MSRRHIAGACRTSSESLAGDLLVLDIGELLTLVPDGEDLLGRIPQAALVIEKGRVSWVGAQSSLPQSMVPRDSITVHAGGALVTPGLVEPHAHPIFAGSRAAEFDLRSQGTAYAEIQRRGGGILSTVRATRDATDEALVEGTLGRLDRLLANGVTACEAKTGYALTVDGELRLLRLLREAGRSHPIALSPTLLCHVPPPDADRAELVDRFVAELLPAARAGGAEALDVFCDVGAFTLDETRRLLLAGRSLGLLLRVHAEQLTHTGAAQLGAELGARSVEHLEHLTDEDIGHLARAGTICTLLPGAALTLRLPFPNARRLLDAGCRVALGTDLNPGSSHTENLPLMMSLGCMQMGMSCAEAWRAVTVTAAAALDRSDEGQLTTGARGNLVLWDTDDHREVPQRYGTSLVEAVIARGVPVFPSTKS